MPQKTFIFNLSCPDRPGIVATLTAALAAAGANIAESAQFWDRGSNTFFMRLVFEADGDSSLPFFENILAPAMAQFGMQARLFDAARAPRIIIMTSKTDHCLNHLLYQLRAGVLKAHVAGIISNHTDCRSVAEAAGIPYHYWPVDGTTRAAQEEKIWALFQQEDAELLVLARYMQVLSEGLCSRLRGRAINIHHSFLPGFKGARPYHQAFDRGVKIIGATAHYVTTDLDEGPIIDQETERVTHASAADDLAATGRDIESRVLSRAVRLHLEGRVLLNGKKTVVL